jgi:NAD(P)-dependent dehydrogenase (short-subunit alcohol dehydrogenase family)
MVKQAGNFSQFRNTNRKDARKLGFAKSLSIFGYHKNEQMQRIVFVTGSSGNLGRAITRKFLDAGDKVIGTVLPEEVYTLSDAEKMLKIRHVDLLNELETKEVIENEIREFGGIDIAVLTAGGFAMGDIAHTETSDFYQQLKLNFETTYNTARPIFLEMLKKGRGRIFMTGSRPGLDMQNGQGMVAYSLSKSLIFRLSELMNEEAKGTDVVVTVLVPSTIDTPQNRKSMPEADFSTWMDPASMAEIIFNYCSPLFTGLREPVLKMYNKA